MHRWIVEVGVVRLDRRWRCRPDQYCLLLTAQKTWGVDQKSMKRGGANHLLPGCDCETPPAPRDLALPFLRGCFISFIFLTFPFKYVCM